MLQSRNKLYRELYTSTVSKNTSDVRDSSWHKHFTTSEVISPMALAPTPQYSENSASLTPPTIFAITGEYHSHVTVSSPNVPTTLLHTSVYATSTVHEAVQSSSANDSARDSTVILWKIGHHPMTMGERQNSLAAIESN